MNAPALTLTQQIADLEQRAAEANQLRGWTRTLEEKLAEVQRIVGAVGLADVVERQIADLDATIGTLREQLRNSDAVILQMLEAARGEMREPHDARVQVVRDLFARAAQDREALDNARITYAKQSKAKDERHARELAELRTAFDAARTQAAALVRKALEGDVDDAPTVALHGALAVLGDAEATAAARNDEPQGAPFDEDLTSKTTETSAKSAAPASAVESDEDTTDGAGDPPALAPSVGFDPSKTYLAESGYGPPIHGFFDDVVAALPGRNVRPAGTRSNHIRIDDRLFKCCADVVVELLENGDGTETEIARAPCTLENRLSVLLGIVDKLEGSRVDDARPSSPSSDGASGQDEGVTPEPSSTTASSSQPAVSASAAGAIEIVKDGHVIVDGLNVYGDTFVVTRRDRSGRRFWTGDEWTPRLVEALNADACWREASDAEHVKPRGSKVVALEDVPALLAKDNDKGAEAVEARMGRARRAG